jgi:hypothetical protein
MPARSRHGLITTGGNGIKTRLSNCSTEKQSGTKQSALLTPRITSKPTRYEVHLDRRLERTLAMLLRLREFRRAAVPS